jgi:hypothetical protein
MTSRSKWLARSASENAPFRKRTVTTQIYAGNHGADQLNKAVKRIAKVARLLCY